MMGSLVKEDLAVCFDEIEDPRLDRSKKYPLNEIVFLAIFGALLGIESWRGLELLGEERLSFLRKFFPYKEGIPSHQTIGRVFSILQPKSFYEFIRGRPKTTGRSYKRDLQEFFAFTNKYFGIPRVEGSTVHFSDVRRVHVVKYHNFLEETLTK